MGEAFFLGDKVRDRVSGFEGIATALLTSLNASSRWTITGQVTDDGVVHEMCIDQERLQLVEADPLKLVEADPLQLVEA